MSKLEKDLVSSRLDDIKAGRPGIEVRLWIDGEPAPQTWQAHESVVADDLDWLIAEVERLTAERDAATQRAEAAERELAEQLAWQVISLDRGGGQI